MDQTKVKLLDCTLRDGGYYNDWDFDAGMVREYLSAMDAISADFVEVGLRSFEADGFKGGFAYSSDDFIRTLNAPAGLSLGVMVNASELVKHPEGVIPALQKLFKPKAESPVSLVRIACHLHEFEAILPGTNWLKEQGYVVGANLMQIADRTDDEIQAIAKAASAYPLDALYFADSMGSMDPTQTSKIIAIMRREWKGPMGIHTHDNMGNALANSLRAVQDGVTWIDGTVTGMGRGPGNVKTEYLAVELAPFRDKPVSITQLAGVIDRHFKPMQDRCGWGTNTYYFLAGKYGIHPTYIQEMLSDSRYTEEDILAVIEYLKSTGGKKFSFKNLELGRQFSPENSMGTWSASAQLSGKTVLIVGAGPSAKRHKNEIERFIKTQKPVVIALNTQQAVSADLIHYRAACHPIRLLADAKEQLEMSQPLIAPMALLPESVKDTLASKQIYDFGLSVQEEKFGFGEKTCSIPKSLVVAYVLAIAASGKAAQVLFAGFDGYGADDPRSAEMDKLLAQYSATPGACPITSITATTYKVPKTSVYALGAYN